MEWTADKLRNLILTNDIFLERSIVKIFTVNQTSTEQSSETTYYQNGIGFNSCDAPFLSSLAQWIEKQTNRNIKEGKRLSPKQAVIARKKMLKYSKQLLVFCSE